MESPDMRKKQDVFAELLGELRKECQSDGIINVTENIISLLTEAAVYFKEDLICPKSKMGITIDKFKLSQSNISQIKLIELYPDSNEYGIFGDDFETFLSISYLEEPNDFLIERYKLYEYMLRQQKSVIKVRLGWLNGGTLGSPTARLEKDLQRQMKALDVVNADIALVQAKLAEVLFENA
jgi:hypothetical protein